MSARTSERLAEQIAALQERYAATLETEQTELLDQLDQVATILDWAHELRIELVRHALALPASSRPRVDAIAAAAHLSRKAMYVSPYKVS